MLGLCPVSCFSVLHHNPHPHHRLRPVLRFDSCFHYIRTTFCNTWSGAGVGGRGAGLGFTCQHGKILDLFSKMLLQRVLNSDQQVAASTSEALNTNESQQSVICCLKLV